MMDLDLGIISEVEKRQKKKLLLDYLYSNLKNHNFWAYRYFFCELLALFNVIGEQLAFENATLDSSNYTLLLYRTSFIRLFSSSSECLFSNFATYHTIIHSRMCESFLRLAVLG